MKTITGKIEAIEALRREKTDVRLRTVTVDGIDYAGSGLLVQHALAALDEGIPNRQRMRVQTALMALVEGTSDLVRWAHANGYFEVVGATEALAFAKERIEQHERKLRALEKERGNINHILTSVLNTQMGLSDTVRDLLEAARATDYSCDYTGKVEPSLNPVDTRAPEPPKGHIFAFMYQPRATQFVEMLQKEGIGSTLTYDTDNNQHRVAVAAQNNEKSLEVYEALKKEMGSGA